MQEKKVTLGSATVNWTNGVGALPVVAGGGSDGLVRIPISLKVTVKEFRLRLSGSWDQSVGAESQATEGNPVLIQSVQLDLDGDKRRLFPGSVLYELARLIGAGAPPKTDPATGTGTGKAFSSVVPYKMGFLDYVIPIQRELPFIDLGNYVNPVLEIQFGAFSRYVSGNTQANMTATVAVDIDYIEGQQRRPQVHFEAPKIVVDMATTGSDRTQALLRTRVNVRGYLLRCGALGATPIMTALTAITNVGIEATDNKGRTQELLQKLPVASYRDAVGLERSGISLTAGYLFLDIAKNRQAAGTINGKALADLFLKFDSSGTDGHSMEIYQLLQKL